MLSKLSCALIRGYRRFISPHKGFRCAYGAHTARPTCSAQGLRIFQRVGFFQGMSLLRRQFDRCTEAAHALRIERESSGHLTPPAASSTAGTYRRYGPLVSQRGFIDGDCGDADCGGGDCGDCDVVSCDTPNCGEMACWDGLTFGDDASRACFDVAVCCDWSPCDNGSTAGSTRRLTRAQEREAERQRQRDARRRKRGDFGQAVEDAKQAPPRDDSNGPASPDA